MGIYKFQPSVNKTQIKDLCSLRFIENKENILFYEIPVMRKIHLAIAIEIEAVNKRYLTHFIGCYDLIENLRNDYNENRLEVMKKHYNKYKVLVIDEIGYLHID